MPEGDTIHSLAQSFRPKLVGEPIEELSIARHGSVTRAHGSKVVTVDAIGKHMLIGFDCGITLRVHLGMKGRWCTYDRGENWSPRKGLASVFLATPKLEFACFRAAQAEVIATAKLAESRALARLGPDLLAEQCDISEIVKRIRSDAPSERAIADTLLDQWFAAGIGNVYKSEVLFQCRINPLTPVCQLSDDTLTKIYTTARDSLASNLGAGPRRTFTEGRRRYARVSLAPRSWVYGRHHKPCLECGTTIVVHKCGDFARTTYYCPNCQAPLRASTLASS